MIKCVALVCATALASAASFAAPADENDDATPSEDCGVASNCGGLGGWRVILLATDRVDAGGDAGGDVEDPVETEEPISNRAPVSVGSITDLELMAGGESETLDAAPFFSDPDGDDLSYAASTSDAGVATATVSGSSVTVAPVAEGTARIAVTARDSGGLSADQTFAVDVSEEAGGVPDLVVVSASVSDANPDAGETFRFSATVRNSGDDRAAATTLRYYRSTNSTISAGDAEVGTDAVRALAAGADSSESISLTAPTEPGTYYFAACVDSVSGESQTSNNCSDGASVEVSDGGGGGDDYVAFDGLTIGDDGSVTLRAGGIQLRTGSSGCIRGIGTYNGRRYGAHWSAWHRNTGSGWSEVSGSRNDDAICGYDLSSAGSGTYRLVGDMTLADERDLYKSANEVTR